MTKYLFLVGRIAEFRPSCLSCNIARILRHVKGGLARDREFHPCTWWKICAKKAARHTFPTTWKETSKDTIVGQVMFVGLSNKSEIGSGAAQYVVPGDDFYFAEEVLGNITNEVVSGSTEISTEQPVTLKSELTNQIGLKGGLSQEVTWIALSADRKTVIDTIDITKNEDGTVSVKPTSGTPLGDYVIAAYSEKYNACKGIDITVAEKKEINVKTFDFQQDSGYVSLNASVENAECEKVLFVIAAFSKDSSGKERLIKAVTKNVAVANGNASVTDMLWSETEILASGTVVKAFIWDNNMTPILKDGNAMIRIP